MDDLSARQLRAAVALARHRSYIAAAAFLGVSQPTLTRTIQTLERLLGVTLFHRGRRQVTPTPAGREFCPSAERWLADLDLQVKGMRELAEQRRGVLVIASLMSIAHRLLPRAIIAYRRRFPSVEIHARAGLQDAVQADVAGVLLAPVGSDGHIRLGHLPEFADIQVQAVGEKEGEAMGLSGPGFLDQLAERFGEEILAEWGSLLGAIADHVDGHGESF